MKKLMTLLILAALVGSCKPDEEEELINRTIFKFSLGELQNNGEAWIVLRDNDTGELIDAKQLVENTITGFESNKKISNDKLTVTFFRTKFGSQQQNLSQVFSGIAVGTEWTYGVPNGLPAPDQGEVLGNYAITIEGIDETTFSVTVSDEFGRVNHDSYGYASGIKRIEYADVNSNSAGKPT